MLSVQWVSNTTLYPGVKIEFYIQMQKFRERVLINKVESHLRLSTKLVHNQFARYYPKPRKKGIIQSQDNCGIPYPGVKIKFYIQLQKFGKQSINQ